MFKLMDKVCCMSLHTFGLVIGWLGVLGSAVGSILSACVLANADEVADALLKFWHIGINAERHAAIRDLVLIYAGIYLAGSLVNLILSGLLVWGTKKNRYLMILPWIIVHAIGLVLNVLLAIGSLFSLFQGTVETTVNFFGSIVSLAIYYYIFWSIYSLYKHIQVRKVTGSL